MKQKALLIEEIDIESGEKTFLITNFVHDGKEYAVTSASTVYPYICAIRDAGLPLIVQRNLVDGVVIYKWSVDKDDLTTACILHCAELKLFLKYHADLGY